MSKLPAPASIYPHAHTELPEGADVTAYFRGKVLWREYDRDSSMELELEDGTRFVLSWQVVGGNTLEDPAPVIEVHSFGFRPGDVCVMYKEGEGLVSETFFATSGSTNEKPIDWLDKDGVLTEVEEANLTLVLRDGVPLPSLD